MSLSERVRSSCAGFRFEDPLDTLKYSHRNGRFFPEIAGHPDYGVPFGQDRLVLLWLATAAVRQWFGR